MQLVSWQTTYDRFRHRENRFPLDAFLGMGIYSWPKCTGFVVCAQIQFFHRWVNWESIARVRLPKLAGVVLVESLVAAKLDAGERGSFSIPAAAKWRSGGRLYGEERGAETQTPRLKSCLQAGCLKRRGRDSNPQPLDRQSVFACPPLIQRLPAP